MGLPFVTHSLLKGYNVDPVQLQALRQRQQEDAQRRLEFSQEQERLRESSLVDRMFREKAAKLQEDDSVFYRGMRGRELDDAIAARAEARQQHQADLERKDREFAAKQTEAAERLRMEREDAARRDREIGMNQDRYDAAQARETTAQQDITNRAQVRTRSRAIIADRVQQLQQVDSEFGGFAAGLGGTGGGAKPEQIRDMMMAETQQADLTPADRQEVQAAIAEWYQEALKAEDNETARKINDAKLEDVDALRSQRQTESAAQRESRERLATAETERKKEADAARKEQTELARIANRKSRVEKDIATYMAFMQASMEAGSEKAEAEWRAKLEKAESTLADLERQEDAVLKARTAPAAANSEWGDTAPQPNSAG